VLVHFARPHTVVPNSSSKPVFRPLPMPYVLMTVCLLLQANLVKQLGKLTKVRYVEDITPTKRVGECLTEV
jgi:hypothetical protein